MVNTGNIIVTKLASSVNKNRMGEEGTRSVVADYVRYRLDSCGFFWDDGRQHNLAPSRVQEAMRRLGDTFEERYHDIMHKLNITEDTALETFSAIMDEMFSDGIVNWGRIVALFGFTGRFVVVCYENDMPGVVDNVVELVTSYVDNHLREWMDTHNQWQGFLEFQTSEPVVANTDVTWPTFRKICGLAVAGLGVITLGALLKQHS